MLCPRENPVISELAFDYRLPVEINELPTDEKLLRSWHMYALRTYCCRWHKLVIFYEVKATANNTQFWKIPQAKVQLLFVGDVGGPSSTMRSLPVVLLLNMGVSYRQYFSNDWHLVVIFHSFRRKQQQSNRPKGFWRSHSHFHWLVTGFAVDFCTSQCIGIPIGPCICILSSWLLKRTSLCLT